jgi:flagellar biosynthesis anti-sigma factor FlgM
MANSIRDIGVMPPSAAATHEPAAQPATDSTTLSPAGGMVAAATRAAGAIKPVRTELVARIKAQIAAGTYRPDPASVAQRVAAELKGMKP